jgi:hypothetical protein
MRARLYVSIRRRAWFRTYPPITYPKVEPTNNRKSNLDARLKLDKDPNDSLGTILGSAGVVVEEVETEPDDQETGS